MTLMKSRPHAGPRWALLATAVAIMTLALAAGSLAVHDVGEFELDKNASNDTSATLLGTLGANINASTTAIPVCETGTPPAPEFTILIEAERMTVTSTASASFGGNCAGVKRTYTVDPRTAPSAASHAKSGVNGNVTLLVEAAKDGPDWNQVHASVTADGNNEGDDDKCLALGLVECSFAEDGIGPSTFIGGASKDHLPISGWQHTSGASPDKAEILNAYAAKAIDENGDQILYFGMDRYAVDGSTDIGFWFFRDEVALNADGTFSGEHQGTLNSNPADNDILALATFTQGGAATNIRVFRWVGSGGNESGTVNGPDADAGDCIQDPPLTDDDLCGTVNDTTIEVPWNYTFKGAATGKWVPAGGLFEGGINLTALGLQGCFSSFLAETRSSPEITAILKDFTLGSFEACGATLSTRPGDGTAGSGNAQLTDDTDEDDLVETSIGTGSVQVRDRATLAVTGTASWTGNLKFWLCGPSDLEAQDTCEAGGTQIGPEAGVTVTNATGQPIVSDAATVTSVGTYCWRATFTSGTNGVPSQTDASANECFEVMPVDPSITTNATATVEIGGAIDDTATLSGTATQPGTPVINPTTAGDPAGGTITFSAYGPFDDTETCTGDPVYTSVITVSGNGDYSASDGDADGDEIPGEAEDDAFVPTAAGTYNWIAVYSGDSPNTLGVSGECGDDNEASVVTPKQPAISTNATAGPVPLGSAIDDTATLSGTSPQPDGDPAGGTITFSAYGPFDDTETCTGDPVYTSVITVSGNGDYSASDGDADGDEIPGEAEDDAFVPTAAGTYNWIAVYSGDSPNTLGVSGECGDDNEASVVISLQPAMTTAQSFVPNDSATITVADGGGDLAGTVVFRLYVNDPTCEGDAAYTSDAIDVSTGSGTGLSRTVLSNNTEAYDDDGDTFHWVVAYTSTNAAHRNVTSECGNEHSSITVNDGTARPSPEPGP